MSPTLVDTSSWVHYFRRGDEAVRERVSGLLGQGSAVWSAPIRLELWNGVGSVADRKILQDFEAWMPDLSITARVWDEACALADRCRNTGQTPPANDVLIAACARHYQVPLEHADAHVDFLLRL